VPCLSTPVVNAASLVLFLVAAALVWRAASRREPSLRPWTMGLTLLPLLFVTNKVNSPQYDLWLLPWFALVLPHPPLFVAFSLAGAAVFFTRYADFADPGVAFQVAALARDAVIGLCVVAYVRRWRTAPTIGRVAVEGSVA
jgi:hypothetical protein